MAVVARYQSPLLRYVGHLLGQSRHESVEDIVQDTFIRLHRQVQKRGADSIANLSTWLYRVAHNRTLDILRSNARRKPRHQAPVEEVARSATDEFDALGEVLREEARQVALEALARLDEDQRQVILLKVIQGLTFRQIAEILDVSLSAVNYRLQQGLTQLARDLKRAGVV
jgi:RNA polymerase sigma-70 factor (ECF subfamily)